MIITLGLWQIAGLIALTLIATGILKRLATLIALVVLGNWSKESASETGLSELSLLKSNFDESPSWDERFSIGYGVSVPLSLGDEEEEEKFSGSTGSTTSGVAYVPAAAVLRSKTSPVYRGRKWRKEVK